MDTPSCPHPVDSQEQEVLKQLEIIRDKLILLKRDRTTYIRSQDVLPLYDELMEQVRLLDASRVGKEPNHENRVDRVLESCFQLISLFFMTIGRNHEAPAAYALTSTIKRLLDHLTESNLVSHKDMESISHTLEKLKQYIENSRDTHDPIILKLVLGRVARCKEMIKKLQSSIETLGANLPAIHERLISILRSISLANTRTKFSNSEVYKLSVQLSEIDAMRKNGNFLAEDGSIAEGSDKVSDLLFKCMKWAEIVQVKKGAIPSAFKPMYNDLVRVRSELDKISMTQAWSLRETDLYDFQRLLDRYDEQRVDGNWLDSEGKPAELYVQRTLLYLLRRCYAYIYSLMISSEPVSEGLLPVYNQLQTLKRCLIEVKNNGGITNPRELYPYSMKLNSIDNKRVDGKFMVNGDIPEGQGSTNELLAECFDMVYELRMEAENAADDKAEAEEEARETERAEREEQEEREVAAKIQAERAAAKS
ncbi:hypothetical protein TD95_001050 [Thielaviopsis punctulata]|uniref:Uncharacterized protein n=1 Tax=Thielaviopsis punctulata TaxID=72032 RepID=A0A0F4Z9X2_9PEZI|nr:hypothetical protein TD95_001050 [Thielaviopsis punctulata]